MVGSGTQLNLAQVENDKLVCILRLLPTATTPNKAIENVVTQGLTHEN
ncbi:hypothetical protein MACH26_03520 [Planctobacterium marinum]|uniref:Uncharacterized protein n=1 Tax=Planctobacterium marinum TaxID=1631968 RepID=A0AA48KMV4_9ALTE|nr:hypothetical protein MACH26_03520 [Planctobacterium marinum]